MTVSQPMPRRVASRRRRRLSLTSLIDVIFLLLLFFMLSSSFTRFGDMPFMAVGSGTSTAATDSPPVFLRVQADQIMLNALEVSLVELPAELERREATTLLIATQDAVSSQRLVDVLGAVRDLPGLSLQLIGG